MAGETISGLRNAVSGFHIEVDHVLSEVGRLADCYRPEADRTVFWPAPTACGLPLITKRLSSRDEELKAFATAAKILRIATSGFVSQAYSFWRLNSYSP